MTSAELFVLIVTSLGQVAALITVYYQNRANRPKGPGGRGADNSGAPISTPACNSFEILVIITVPLVGFSSLAMGDPIYALQYPYREIFYTWLALGTGIIALSLFMPMPTTLRIEQIGMILLAVLLLPYAIGLIIENSIFLPPAWILFIGYGMACAARALQIARHMRQYDRASLVGA